MKAANKNEYLQRIFALYPVYLLFNNYENYLKK